MAIIYQNNCCKILDHNSYIKQIYQEYYEAYQLRVELFSIIKKVRKFANKRKRKHHNDEVNDVSFVRNVYESLLHNLPMNVKTSVKVKKNMNTESVRDLSKGLFEKTVFDHIGLSGGNNSNQPISCDIKGEKFIIPQHSRFYCGCVKTQCEKLNGNKYDLVIADPPWWNKYIRRLKAANDKLSYSMMYNEDIASIPVRNLLAPNSLIAVWCTNAPSNIKALKEEIFPQWGVEYLTTWYWLKITNELESLCDFGLGSQKQPYERILLAKVGDITNIPEDQLIVSVPSALHSHKPPLLEVLSPYLNKEKVDTLELFARYLLPNTTSVGYEPLKWQHMSLYESIT